jgi:hypothetical protein
LPPHFSSTILLDWYKEMIFQSPLNLYMPLVYGYQRILYVLNDRFNNTIYVPIDADIANLTQITMTVTPVVNATNPNQTTILINGTAGYYNYNGFDIANQFWVPLPNGQIYLYYGEDLNYNGLSKSDSQLCAFGSATYPFNTTPYPSTCVLSNPEYTLLQTNAQTKTYMTSNSGICPAPPNSLLYGTTVNCNIYGKDNRGTTISSTCTNSNAYCIPIFYNGSGQCTTQAGLMNMVTTNSMGGFSYNAVACGIGHAKIIASFYGAPTSPLEPIKVYQSPLTAAAASLGTTYTTFCSLGVVPFNAIGFTWALNTTSALTEIGLFELSFGAIGKIALIAAICTALLILIYKSNKRVKKMRRRKTGH